LAGPILYQHDVEAPTYTDKRFDLSFGDGAMFRFVQNSKEALMLAERINSGHDT
jgi:hypothetical protein